MRRQFVSAMLSLCVLAASAVPSRAEATAGSDWPPWDYAVELQITAPPIQATSVGSERLPVEVLLTGYQYFVSPTNGMQCPMHPSCSDYARLAISDRGLHVGVAMTLDRLCRCGHDLRFYDMAHVDRGLRWDDPPVPLGLRERPGSSRRIASAQSDGSAPRGRSRADSQQSCRDQLRFAEILLGEGDHYRAIGEYKRVFHFCDDDTMRTEADLGVGRALLLAGKYQSVLEWYERPTDLRDVAAADLTAGHAMFRLEEYERAIPVLLETELRAATSMDTGQARYLEGLCLVRLERWDEGRTAFSRVEAGSSFYAMAQRHHERLSVEPSYPIKDPAKAGVLAVVPGLGYAYTGHLRTALAAIVVNGLLGWAAVDALRDDHTAAGASLAGLALGFYVGNIMGSVESAHRYNQWQYDRVQAGFPE